MPTRGQTRDDRLAGAFLGDVGGRDCCLLVRVDNERRSGDFQAKTGVIRVRFRISSVGLLW